MQGLGPHWEMWAFVQGGMTPLEAIRVATRYPAETLGLDKDLGYEGFEEDGDILKAFIPEAQFVAGELHEILQGLPPGMQLPPAQL